LVAAPSTSHEVQARQRVEEKEKEKEKLSGAKKAACTISINQMNKHLFRAGAGVACDSLLNGLEEKLASSARHKLDASPSRGRAILQSAFGLGRGALRKEATLAVGNCEKFCKQANRHSHGAGSRRARMRKHEARAVGDWREVAPPRFLERRSRKVR
jgi:hypothetical protein